MYQQIILLSYLSFQLISLLPFLMSNNCSSLYTGSPVLEVLFLYHSQFVLHNKTSPPVKGMSTSGQCLQRDYVNTVENSHKYCPESLLPVLFVLQNSLRGDMFLLRNSVSLVLRIMTFLCCPKEYSKYNTESQHDRIFRNSFL